MGRRATVYRSRPCAEFSVRHVDWVNYKLLQRFGGEANEQLMIHAARNIGDSFITDPMVWRKQFAINTLVDPVENRLGFQIQITSPSWISSISVETMFRTMNLSISPFPAQKPAHSTSRFGYDRGSVHRFMEFLGDTSQFCNPPQSKMDNIAIGSSTIPNHPSPTPSQNRRILCCPPSGQR